MNTYNYQITPVFGIYVSNFTLANVRFPENLITLNLNLTRSNSELKLKPAQLMNVLFCRMCKKCTINYRFKRSELPN